MRLINCETFELVEVIEPTEPYAILSHTWGSTELSFHDYSSQRENNPAFRKKIKPFCKIARKNGIRFGWVDTCCIDKSSSAELSESINSMWKYYLEAKVCYVYLSDVLAAPGGYHESSDFAKSRWFTRGWTLQELIAPKHLVFFSKDWNRIGDKTGMTGIIKGITGIDQHALNGKPLDKFSVARRMSWASSRKTTRQEDLAYCLLGIFNINMPMLYGEGYKAFTRLQEEIIKTTDDHSIFAWKTTPELAAKWPFRGILADHPAEFAGCGNIEPIPTFSAPPVPMIPTSRGIPLTCRLIPITTEPRPFKNLIKEAFIVLDCFDRTQGTNSSILVEISGIGGDRYLRSSPSFYDTLNDRHFPQANEGLSTVWLPKTAHEKKLDLMPNHELQHGFYVLDNHLSTKGKSSLKGWYYAWPDHKLIDIPYHEPLPLVAWIVRDNMYAASFIFRDGSAKTSLEIALEVGLVGPGSSTRMRLQAKVTDFATEDLGPSAANTASGDPQQVVEGHLPLTLTTPFRWSLVEDYRNLNTVAEEVCIRVESRRLKGTEVFCLLLHHKDDTHHGAFFEKPYPT